jgi:hypothetical protein
MNLVHPPNARSRPIPPRLHPTADPLDRSIVQSDVHDPPNTRTRINSSTTYDQDLPGSGSSRISSMNAEKAASAGAGAGLGGAAWICAGADVVVALTGRLRLGAAGRRRTPRMFAGTKVWSRTKSSTPSARPKTLGPFGRAGPTGPASAAARFSGGLGKACGGGCPGGGGGRPVWKSTSELGTCGPPRHRADAITATKSRGAPKI